MATVTVLACDVCGTIEQVRHYGVTCDGDAGETDLCAAHDGPLRAALAARGTTTPPKAATARRAPRKRATAFTKTRTLEQIEAEKQGKG